jgi:hypothetical protein
MNTYPTQEDAESTLTGWRRLGKGVFSKGDKRAYVTHFASPTEFVRADGQKVIRPNAGWMVSYWPAVEATGRKSKDEIGGRAWN